MSEMNIKEMNMVTGGYALDGGDGMYYSVDDKTGSVLTACNINIEYAVWASGMNGVSKEVITKAQYEKKFGKPFSPKN